jgi:hypothetical protein
MAVATKAICTPATTTTDSVDQQGHSPASDLDKAHFWIDDGDIYDAIGPGEAKIYDDPGSYSYLVWARAFDQVIDEGIVPALAGSVGTSSLLNPDIPTRNADFATLAYMWPQPSDEEEQNGLVDAVLEAHFNLNSPSTPQSPAPQVSKGRGSSVPFTVSAQLPGVARTAS